MQVCRIYNTLKFKLNFILGPIHNRFWQWFERRLDFKRVSIKDRRRTNQPSLTQNGLQTNNLLVNKNNRAIESQQFLVQEPDF